MTKVSRGAIIGLTTNIASPSPSIFKPRNKCIDVGSTFLASYNTSRARGNGWYFVGTNRKRTKQPAQNYFTGRGQLSRLRNLSSCEVQHFFWVLYIPIHIFFHECLCSSCGRCCSCGSSRRLCHCMTKFTSGSSSRYGLNSKWPWSTRMKLSSHYRRLLGQLLLLGRISSCRRCSSIWSSSSRCKGIVSTRRRRRTSLTPWLKSG
mmetsp:Transcript_12110/g.17456  ORF Transcript_12110/g.17456 Transcript_12110/m.17456 type:complete len:205 (+) Transcript_12110:2230-2844(+)